VQQRVLGLCLLPLAFVLAAARPTSAQDLPAFSLSYDFIYHELSKTSALGAHADVAKTFGTISGVAEAGVNHFDGYTDVSIAGGGRYLLTQVPRSNIQPAVQVLIGVWRCGACAVTEAFLQPGALIDYAQSASVKIRGQFDVRRIFFDFGGKNAVRVSIGLVWDLD
jgi:hypothetical protein